jgi:AraC-like DNA-binding protein
MREFNGLVLRQGDLEKKLPASSPFLRRQVERYISTVNVAPRDVYVHRVTQVIAMALRRNEARADLVAAYLGTNRRTLNRRLARSRVNYSQLLQQTRKSLSVQYMLGGRRPLADIAELVGFASSNAFSQWFQRSFGRSPTEWREGSKRSRSRRRQRPIP